MLSYSHKFPLRTQFLEFKKLAKRITAPNFLAYYSPSEHSRLAVIIPKKVNKLATTRNWLKRLVYDHLWDQIKDKNLDLVIVFKPLPLIKGATTKEKIYSQINKLELN